MDRTRLLDILTDTSRVHTSYVERQVAQLGIHSGQGALLSALDIIGPCSQKELANFRQVSAATISVMLGRMESRGFILRLPSEEGGKRNQILLTDEGRRMAHELRDFMPREAEKVFAGLTEEELETAERIFQTIRKNIDKNASAKQR